MTINENNVGVKVRCNDDNGNLLVTHSDLADSVQCKCFDTGIMEVIRLYVKGSHMGQSCVGKMSTRHPSFNQLVRWVK